jgi:hypothetical protein
MAKKVAKKVSNKRHWGITVLGILGYIGAVATLLLGLTMLIGSAFISDLITQFVPNFATYAAAGTVLFIVLGIIFIGLAILDYFIARGLLNGRNWARILLIIFAALGLLGSLHPFSIGSLVIEGLIIWYLGFYKPAVNYFK